MPEHSGIPNDRGRRRQRDPSWISKGGETLPLTDGPDRNGQVWLFTCCGCGTRWADPPAPVSGCSCGSDEIVCHRFDHDVYLNIRAHGQPEDPAGGEP